MIFYFSGTGNTKWVAEYIASSLGDRAVRIPSELNDYCNYTLADGESLGLCFPIHGWQPPRIFREFIDRLSVNNIKGHYIYSVCTCGDTVGNAIGMLSKDLKKKKWELASAFSLIMPESYVCLPFMYTDTQKREEEKISVAGIQLKQIVEDISRKNRIFRIHKGPAPFIYTSVIGQLFNKKMITDKPFTVDKSKCVSCGKCASVCPVGNISFEEFPSWHIDNSCTNCLACYHYCPKHAINYGRITNNRGQYYFKTARCNKDVK